MNLPMPYEENKQDHHQKVELEPLAVTDPPNRWRRFLDDLRAIVGAKSLHLCERLAEAKVRAQEVQVETLEVENEIRLLKAKQEYEEVMARNRQLELVALAKAEKNKADTDQIRARTQAFESVARLAESSIDSRKMSREEARLWLEAVVQKIEMVHGGSIEEITSRSLPETDKKKNQSINIK